MIMFESKKSDKGKNVVAFSGGKDSTALALRMNELGEDFELLFTPTGDELPELNEHLHAIAARVGKPLITPPNRSLADYIDQFNALPNHRMRWCTRAIKIEPCIAYLKQHPGSTLIVGLRADEEERQGLYGDYAKYRYPLREWGWGINDVWGYLKRLGVRVPLRTDCAVCYGQRISEWYRLWLEHPDRFARGEQWEGQTGHTFRSAQRDTWPAALKDLRGEFEKGRKPRRCKLDVLDDSTPKACRVCSL